MDIGFVGLGNMGGPMVANLLKAGHRVHVFDLSDAAMGRAVAVGAVAAGSPRGAAEAGEMVLTSLPTPGAVEAVYLGPDGLLEGAREGQLFFDLSSISPSLARKMAAAFAEKGATLLDSPVSGGTPGAQAATLAIMVGGDPEAFKKGEPVLKDIGKNVFHVGPVGTSSTIKILNQLMVGINNVAISEMIAVALRAGMDMEQVKAIISVSSGGSNLFQIEFPKGVARDFAPGFAVDLMAKDLRLARDLSQELGLQLTMVPTALSVFESASKQGMGGDDVSAALRLYEAAQD